MHDDDVTMIDDITGYLPPGCYLAGGAARAYMMRYHAPSETIKDCDLFFVDAPTRLIASEVLQASGWTFHDAEGHIVRLSSKLVPWKLELVDGRYHETIEDLFESFDFVCCRFGFSSTSRLWTCSDAARADALARVVAVEHVNGTVARTRHRIARYASRGWMVRDDVERLLTAAEEWEAAHPGERREPY